MVANFIKNTANDPDSIKWDRWYKPHVGMRNGQKCWVVYVTFLGKNAFGGVIRQSGHAYIRNGRVIDFRLKD